MRNHPCYILVRRLILPLLLIAASLMLFIQCRTGGMAGIESYTGFVELKFPNNSYGPGQIIEVYSTPEKVEITFDPHVPWDQASSSPGWDTNSINTSGVQANVAAEIKKAVEGTLGFTDKRTIKVSLTNTRTSLIPKNIIYAKLKESIAADKSLQQQLADYMKQGTHFDVITSVLSCDIAFSLVDENNQEVALDAPILAQINSKFNLNLQHQAGTNLAVTGTNLIVGISYDTNMVSIITASGK